MLTSEDPINKMDRLGTGHIRIDTQPSRVSGERVYLHMAGRSGRKHQRLEWADFNGDGRLDFVAVPAGRGVMMCRYTGITATILLPGHLLPTTDG